MPDTLHVRINSPEKLIWEGEADSVTSENSAGPFDILPMHANFITLIKKKPINVIFDKKPHVFNFSNSVIYAHGNKVLIYTNI